jgi:mannitol-specific phosphotransferase system IIBC component
MVLKDFLRTLLGIVEQGYEVVVLSFSVDTIEFSLRINTFSTLWKVVRKSYRS